MKATMSKQTARRHLRQVNREWRAEQETLLSPYGAKVAEAQRAQRAVMNKVTRLNRTCPEFRRYAAALETERAAWKVLHAFMASEVYQQALHGYRDRVWHYETLGRH
jgi:hypothetical protein